MKLALIGLLAAACAGRQPGPQRRIDPPDPAHPDAAPRLVVLLVIDQLPAWAFEQKRPAFTGGFARILSEGEWKTGRVPSFATLTAPGHALLSTGESPATSGIIGNEWYSRSDGVRVRAAETVDGVPTAERLRVPGLGDAVASSGRGGKAIAIALKNRAAILSLGGHGLAVFYDAKTGTWTSYGAAGTAKATTATVASRSPAWLAAHDRAHPIRKRLAPWTPLDPARLAQLSGTVDAQRGEVGEKGFGPTFPHDPAATKNPLDAVYAMPLGNELVLEVARAAIGGEGLGTDRVPDLLVVSLSAHDYIGHGWGHESWEAWDAALRLDAQLEAFLADLDRTIGAGRYAMIVTSDHGASPLPERAGGGRYTFEEIQRAANNAASLELGGGEWIASASYPTVTLTPAALTRPKTDLKKAMRKVIAALRSFPGLALVDRTDAYSGSCDARTGEARAICLGLDPERSGDFVYVPARGWVLQEAGEPLATAHGSFHDYDQLVPVLLLPFGRTPHAPQSAPSGELPLSEVAPTLRGWLGEPSR
jgi:hypothetical protein